MKTRHRRIRSWSCQGNINTAVGAFVSWCPGCCPESRQGPLALSVSWPWPQNHPAPFALVPGLHLPTTSLDLLSYQLFDYSNLLPWYLLNIFKIILLGFFLVGGLCLVFFAAHGLSLVLVSGSCSPGAVQASHCADFSCCSDWALGYAGFSSCGWPALELRLSSCGTGA